MAVRFPALGVALALLISTTSVAQNGSPADAFHAADGEIADGLRKEGVAYETKRAIVWVERGSLTEAESKEFAGLVDRGILDVEKYTGIGFDGRHFRAKKIEYFISSKAGISHASDDGKPFVYLTPKRVRDGSAAYVHETTHVIVWRDMPLWLLEGFPSHVETYLEKRYGGRFSNVFNPENRPVDELARDILKQPIGARVLPLVGVSGKFDALGDEEAKTYSFIFEDRKVAAPAFYNLSESFVTFLVERVGMKKMRRIVESDADDTRAVIESVTGKSTDAWKAEWLKSLAT
jgi:hypothetical protein